MFNSFLPTKGNIYQNGEYLEGQQGEFDPNDEQSEDFGPRTTRLVDKILEYEEKLTELEQQQEQMNLKDGMPSYFTLAEQQDQMLFSSLVILFKVLKNVRIQDVIGDNIQ